MALMRLPESYYSKNVMKCSGGEKQRVALARAFAYDPEILFFDEPLSALDYKLRKTLEKELKDIHRQTGKTFVYITHSLEEAMVMSDRIGVMRAGGLAQVGTPEDIYMRPQSKFIAEFMGETNTFAVRRKGAGLYEGTDIKGTFQVAGKPKAESGYLIVRPEFLRILGPKEKAENEVKGQLYNDYSLGSRRQYRIMAAEKPLVVESSRRDALALPKSGALRLGWNAADAIFVAE
jgi:spermidine/putrescine transport system ATP-binding protein